MFFEAILLFVILPAFPFVLIMLIHLFVAENTEQLWIKGKILLGGYLLSVLMFFSIIEITFCLVQFEESTGSHIGTILIVVIYVVFTLSLWYATTADELYRAKEPHSPSHVLGRMFCQVFLFGMILVLAMMIGGCGNKILVPY